MLSLNFRSQFVQHLGYRAISQCSKIREIRSMNEINSSLFSLNDKSLVVVDVDDVLITPKDKILQPCAKLLKPNPLDLIHGMEEAQKKKYLSQIYTQTKMQLIETGISLLLEKLKRKKIKVIALTAFETPVYGIIKDTAQARIRELLKFNIDFKYSFPQYPSLQLKEQFKQNYPLFKNGILFSAPHSKGKVLNAFLETISFLPEQTVFIDDSIENLQSVMNETGSKTSLQCFHYLGASKLPGKASFKVCEKQVQHLLKTGKWLSDAEAEKTNTKMEKHAMIISEKKVIKYLFDQKNITVPTLITPYHWPDIDGIASMYSLEHLLRKVGYKNVRGMISQTPQKEAAWLMDRFNLSYPQIETTSLDQVILVDVSDHRDLPPSLPLNQVKVVIDHRLYTDLSCMPNATSWIEPVGSAATLIFSLYQQKGVLPDPQTALLLYAAIMSNTIRCRTRNTTPKDMQAAEILRNIGKPDAHFINEMFEAKSDLNGIPLLPHLDDDLSSKLQLINGERTAVAQLEIIGVEKLIHTRYDELALAMQILKERRGAEKIFLVGVDLIEGRTYFLFSDNKLKELVNKHFKLIKKNGYYVSEQTLTRKDVIYTLIS